MIIDGYGGGGFDFGQDQAGVDSRHTFDWGQAFNNESLKVFAISDDHLEQVIVLSGDMMALQHLG